MNTKVVIRSTDLATGKKDVIVKAGDFENTPESVAAAYVAGLYDKYALVSKTSVYAVPDGKWNQSAPHKSSGMLVKRNSKGVAVKRLVFEANFCTVR